LLYCASWQGAVTVWKTDAVNPGQALRTIAGKEVKGPISFAFTDREPHDEFVYTLTAALEQTPGKVAFFESQIRPLLHARCMECHDQETQEGGLRLDTPNGWELGGHTGRAIQPGRPEESLLYRAVAYLDKDLKMPHRTPQERIETIFLVAYGRHARDTELQRWLDLFGEISSQEDPMADKAAWAQLAHTVFNTKEFLHYR
jgi:hypothetical protein